MRSLPTYTKVLGFCTVVALIALAGFSQTSVHAGVPAQATTAATTAASGGSSSTSATTAATVASSGSTSATTAATTASSGGTGSTSATAAAMTYPPCPPSATASAAGTTAANATVAANATMAAAVATPNANPGYLGIRAEQVDDCGVRVVEVVAGQPASKSTIKADDVIVAMNGTTTPDILTLRQMIENDTPGTTITLTVENASGQSDVTVTLGSVPASAGAVATMPATAAGTPQ